MAEIKGISLPGMITPNGDDANEFPTHEDIYGKGGLMAVKDLSEIKSARLKENMIASTPNGLFRYTGSEWEEISGLGKDTVGSESLPIYLNNGTPTQIIINDISNSSSTGTSGPIGTSGTTGTSGNTGIEAVQPYVVSPTIAYPILVSNSGIKSNSKITTNTSGYITATGFKVGEKCTIKYDSANECIKFEF